MAVNQLPLIYLFWSCYSLFFSFLGLDSRPESREAPYVGLQLVSKKGKLVGGLINSQP